MLLRLDMEGLFETILLQFEINDPTIPTDNQKHRSICGRNHRTRIRKHLEGPRPPNFDSLTVFAHRSDDLTFEDTQMVANQLGYLPSNLIKIAARDENLNPVVTLLYPLNHKENNFRYSVDKKPFPTIIWITCPLLRARISKLEHDGWVSKFQQRLHAGDIESMSFLAMMEEAHKAYAKERWELLTKEDQELVIKNGWSEAYDNVGVAGIRDFTQVKCLHGHYAHYRARPEHNNIIGKWVQELLDNNIDTLT